MKNLSTASISELRDVLAKEIGLKRISLFSDEELEKIGLLLLLCFKILTQQIY